jgi:hypothetical protein
MVPVSSIEAADAIIWNLRFIFRHICATGVVTIEPADDFHLKPAQATVVDAGQLLGRSRAN